MSKSPRTLRYASADAMPPGMRKMVQAQQQPGYRGYKPPPAPAKPSKYRAVPTVVDGIRFDSKAEARYYSELKARVQAGLVEFFLRQVPVHMGSNEAGDREKYVMDFLEFLPCTCGGCECQRFRVVDVKGVVTREFKRKKRRVEALFPFHIELP